MFPLSVVAGFALGIGLVCWRRKAAPRFTAYCFLIVGIALAGWAGRAMDKAIGTATVAANRVGVTLLGVGLGTVIAAAALTWLFHDLRKKGKVSKLAPLVALIVPSLLPVVFVSLMAIPAMHDFTVQVKTFVAEMRSL
jgi:hypothetical protein